MMPYPTRPAMKSVLFLLCFSALLFASPTTASESLIENGSFDDPEDPFRGWVIDYAWTGNQNYIRNKELISLEASEAGQSNVLRILPRTDAGAKFETIPIVFEPGYRYFADFKVKGGPWRIYFAGYRWKPGVRPHDNPTLGELRMVYRSNAWTESVSGWTNVTIEIPGVDLTPAATRHLQTVRFVTVFFYYLNHTAPGFVNDVRVRKVADPSLQL